MSSGQPDLMVGNRPLSSLRVVDLKQELEKRGLSKSGSKKDLCDRLRLNLQIEKHRDTGASADEEELPNYSVHDELADQNPFIRDYLASQAELFHSQKVVKKLVEEEAKRESETSADEGVDSPVKQTPILEKSDDSFEPRRNSRRRLDSQKEDMTAEKIVATRTRSSRSKSPAAATNVGISEATVTSVNATVQNEEPKKSEALPETEKPAEVKPPVLEKEKPAEAKPPVLEKEKPAEAKPLVIEKENKPEPKEVHESKDLREEKLNDNNAIPEVVKQPDSKENENSLETTIPVVPTESKVFGDVADAVQKLSSPASSPKKSNDLVKKSEPSSNEDKDLEVEKTKTVTMPETSPTQDSKFEVSTSIAGEEALDYGEDEDDDDSSKEKPGTAIKSSGSTGELNEQLTKAKELELPSKPPEDDESTIESKDEAKDKEQACEPKLLSDEDKKATQAIIVESVPVDTEEKVEVKDQEHVVSVPGDNDVDEASSAENEELSSSPPQQLEKSEMETSESTVKSDGEATNQTEEQKSVSTSNASPKEYTKFDVTGEEPLDYGEDDEDDKNESDTAAVSWTRRELKVKVKAAVDIPTSKWTLESDSKHLLVKSELLNKYYEDIKLIPLEQLKLEEKSGEREIPESKVDSSRKMSVSQEELDHHHHEPLPTRTVENIQPSIKRTVSVIPSTRVSVEMTDENEKKLTPPRNPPTNVLLVTNLVRPFTLPQLKEMLQRTGNLQDIWVDKIKSKCIAKFESQEEAYETRAALHGVKWPSSNPKSLYVDYTTQDNLDEHKMKDGGEQAIVSEKIGASQPAPVREWDMGKKAEPKSPRRNRGKRSRSRSKSRERDATKRSRRSASPGRRRHSRSPGHERRSRGREGKEPEPLGKALDELFRKTVAAPSIYWLPLTPEQIGEKEELRRKRMVERERRLAELNKMRPR